jgi:hypothetical protein
MVNVTTVSNPLDDTPIVIQLDENISGVDEHTHYLYAPRYATTE